MMAKYIKTAEQEKLFLEEIGKVGVDKFVCMADGKFDYYQITLTNGNTRWWKTKTSDFEEKLNSLKKDKSDYVKMKMPAVFIDGRGA